MFRQKIQSSLNVRLGVKMEYLVGFCTFGQIKQDDFSETLNMTCSLFQWKGDIFFVNDRSVDKLIV